ncbi:hypothetical protein [Sphingomonas sp. VNH70]|uniref:hypothetical protein n=1 Tax=Sphingomonas silueang TaxID=3156617 RepID=UPI0032B38CE6
MAPLDVSHESGGQFGLGETARSWTALWLTLKATGWNASMASCPSSHPVRVSFKHGTGSYITTLRSNPRFYEMTMGWPIGWSDPAQPVTGYVRWLHHARGQFSRLLTDWTPEGEPTPE